MILIYFKNFTTITVFLTSLKSSNVKCIFFLVRTLLLIICIPIILSQLDHCCLPFKFTDSGNCIKNHFCIFNISVISNCKLNFHVFSANTNTPFKDSFAFRTVPLCKNQCTWMYSKSSFYCQTRGLTTYSKQTPVTNVASGCLNYVSVVLKLWYLKDLHIHYRPHDHFTS